MIRLISDLDKAIEENKNTERPTSKEVEAWVIKFKNTVVYEKKWMVFSGWPETLWKKPYSEIVDFLTERFRTTLSEPEYYLCILYLWKHTEKESLYVPFKESWQYCKILGMGTNTGQKKNVRMRGIKQGKTRNIKIRGG